MRALLLAICVLLVPATPAVAAETIVTRYGPVELSPYEVERGDQVYDIPKPDVDGAITRMSARLVYADGTPVPIANTMLHHIVFLNLGAYVGEHRDPTCERFRMFDSQSFLPLAGHRFFGLGEERAELMLPAGYGYPIKRSDRWAMTYMLMNHRPASETVFIEYTTVVEQEAVKPITPVWLDVRDCNLDPVFDVPGGRPRNSTHTETTTWTAPQAGRVVFGGSHVHGGGLNLTLSKPDCGSQQLYRSPALWGEPSHPYYRVKPLLHEPGPIAMAEFSTPTGFPVAAGEKLQLSATYDAERPHPRSMGIMLVAFAPDPAVKEKCAGLPSDVLSIWLKRKGRLRPPRIKVPITSAPTDGSRKARIIKRPPGATVELASGATVDVADTAFAPANARVKRGSTLTWHFFDEELHNVTLANGPRGFSSDNLSRDREFAYRFTEPGSYRLFCTLHPVSMAATVEVTR